MLRIALLHGVACLLRVSMLLGIRCLLRVPLRAVHLLLWVAMLQLLLLWRVALTCAIVSGTQRVE